MQPIRAPPQLSLLADVTQGHAWARDALCRAYPELDWFSLRNAQIAEAKAVGRRCS